MKEFKEKLVVFIVTYNHEKFIEKAIQSVLNQKTEYDYKIIIGDDCSTDKTKEICLKYAKYYPDKISYQRREKNLGVFKNTYKLLQDNLDNVDYWTLLDGDDHWTNEHKIQISVDFLNKHSEYSCYSHQTLYLKGIQKTEPYNSDIAVNILRKRNNTIELKKDECFILPHTSSRIYRNVIKYQKYKPYYLFDVTLFLMALLEGPIYFDERYMSVYNCIPHNSLFRDIVDRPQKVTQKYKALKMQAVILAQFSKSLNWAYDKAISYYLGKKDVDNNYVQEWCKYIKDLKEETYFHLNNKDITVYTTHTFKYRCLKLLSYIFCSKTKIKEIKNIADLNLNGKYFKSISTKRSLQSTLINRVAKILKIPRPFNHKKAYR